MSTTVSALRTLLLLAAVVLASCDGDTTIVQQPPDGGGPPPVDPNAFTFRTDAPDAFVRVDRMGQPATTTALLMPGSSGGARRQQFNVTNPQDDAQYAQEYITALRNYHFELGPVLDQLTLDACGVPGATAAATEVNKCVAQAAPIFIPDVLRLDTSRPSNWPNGRRPDDPVVDRLLAFGLLDLTDPAARCLGAPCTVNTLANLPLNVRQSTPPSLPNFPYLNNEQLAPPPPATP